jgi:esterase/lipase
MPVFFFLGRRDHQVPAETSAAYFDVLTAPSKRLVWFEESRHEPWCGQLRCDEIPQRAFHPQVRV